MGGNFRADTITRISRSAKGKLNQNQNEYHAKENLSELIESIAREARLASIELATLSTAIKNKFLIDLADTLEAESEQILEANALDIANAEKIDLTTDGRTIKVHR